MKSYSQDLRDIVIGAYISGEKNISKLSRVYKISYPTAWDWVNRYRTTGGIVKLTELNVDRKSVV